MPEPAVETLLYLFRRAFDEGEHGLARNLAAVTEDQWDAIVPGQPFGRSIGWIAWHAVAGKHLYWDHAFGERRLTGDYTEQGVLSPRRTKDDVIAYGREWQQRWLEKIEQLTDADLQAPTKAHWGATLSMRRVISAVLEHDIYHAGEINHLRAVLDGTDKAPGEQHSTISGQLRP